MTYYAIFVCSVFHVPYGCIYFVADVYLKRNQDMLVQTKIMNRLKLQIIRIPAYSLCSLVQSSRSNHPFLISNHIFVQAYNLSAPAADLFCIAGLKVLSFRLYITAVLLVCSFCRSRSVMGIYAVCVLFAAVRLFPQIFLYSLLFFHWIGSFIVCLQTGGW